MSGARATALSIQASRCGDEDTTRANQSSGVEPPLGVSVPAFVEIREFIVRFTVPFSGGRSACVVSYLFEKECKNMPSLNSITFDTTGLLPQGDRDGVRVWHTPDGDGVGLYYFPLAPDILADISSLSSVSHFYGDQIAAANAVGIMIDPLQIDGCRVVKMIIRVPQQPSGMIYLGSLTLPFRNFSFVVKMQCAEHGITGMREAVVMDELLRRGEIGIDKAGKIEGWETPLDSTTSPYWKSNRAEVTDYDMRFPEHPLSILRRTFGQIEGSLKVSDDVKGEPRFSYPKDSV
jgi:hypothetical protein